jgi:hypothetical protein
MKCAFIASASTENASLSMLLLCILLPHPVQVMASRSEISMLGVILPQRPINPMPYDLHVSPEGGDFVFAQLGFEHLGDLVLRLKNQLCLSRPALTISTISSVVTFASMDGTSKGEEAIFSGINAKVRPSFLRMMTLPVLSACLRTAANFCLASE